MSEVLNKTVELVLTKPEYSKYLKRIVEYEKEHCNDEYFHIGWRYDDVSVPGHVLYQLAVKHGILRVMSTRSRGPANYLLVDRDMVEKALNEIDERRKQPVEEGEEEIPPDLFEPIIGYTRVKEMFFDAQNSDVPVHILLCGPPASCKSMFLLELDRLPKSHFALGGQTSQVGIADELFEYAPKYLIIDEIDDMPKREQSVLKSLMESGVVVRRKHGIRDRGTFKTWVFGGANSTRNLSDAIKSRFLKVYFTRYTEEQFREVVESVLQKRYGVSPELSKYIAERTAKHTRDPREAIGLAKVARTEEKVDKYISLLWEADRCLSAQNTP